MDDEVPPPLQLVDAYRNAVLAKDVAAFTALYDDDVRVFDLWGRWSHDGINAWRIVVEAWFGSLGDDRVAVAFDAVRSSVAHDAAIVHAFVRYSALAPDDKVLRSMSNRLTWGLRRSGDRWTIVHEHTSAPVDDDTMKAILKR